MQHSCERTTYSVITRRLYLLRARNRKIVEYVPRTRSDRRHDLIKWLNEGEREKKKKKRLDGATVVVINISEEEFFFSFLFHPTERTRRTELRQMLAWWRAINLIFSRWMDDGSVFLKCRFHSESRISWPPFSRTYGVF